MPDRPAKHGPNRLTNYSSIHETRMNGFRSNGFVGADTLNFYHLSDSKLAVAGQIGCKGRILIDVTKLMTYIDPLDEPDPRVQTESYAYNVSVQGIGNVFRYDNQHSDPAFDGHADGHHKHVFDWKTNDELPESPIWVGEDGWPTLSEVIEQAQDWYSEVYTELPDPDGFPTKLRQGFRS